jgi:hypothetical protein
MGFVAKNDYAILNSDGTSFNGNSGGYFGVVSVDDTQYSTGKHRVAVRCDGGVTALGVASVTSVLDGFYILGRNDNQRGYCINVSDNQNWPTGAIYPDGVASYIPFAVGDTIEMEVDFDNGSMEIFKNGISFGICFSDVNTLLKPLYFVAYALGSYGQLSLTTATGVISAPNNLVATGGDAKVTLTWTAVTDATGYNVKRATTAGGPYTTIASNVTGTSYVDTGLANGTTYYYVVTAITTDGESGNSNEASATPQAGGVNPPAGNGNAILVVNMYDGRREYALPQADVGAFIAWYDAKAAGSGAAYYVFDKSFNLGPFASRKDYLVFDKIIDFEVMAY